MPAPRKMYTVSEALKLLLDTDTDSSIDDVPSEECSSDNDDEEEDEGDAGGDGPGGEGDSGGLREIDRRSGVHGNQGDSGDNGEKEGNSGVHGNSGDSGDNGEKEEDDNRHRREEEKRYIFRGPARRRQRISHRHLEDSGSSDNETLDPEWKDTSHRSRPRLPNSRDQTQQRGRGCIRTGRHGAASDQVRAPHHQLGAVPGPGNEWLEKDWQPINIPFTQSPGPINAAAALDSELPADFAELYISDELVQNIVNQTNLYANQCIQAQTLTSPHSRIHAWKPVTVSEMKTFLGLFFLTGIIRKPELEMYWSADEILATSYFCKVMSRNRFEIIWKFLHFSDNETRPVNSNDKLYKVRPVLDYLVCKFREMYQPNTNICIDEGVLLWRGRLAFKVYNPQKPIKYGIKSYILCDSETGYCFNVKPYCGESAPLGETVTSLLDRLAGHGYRLFMDNYYNSVGLCERLLDLKTHVCGTLRKNRGEPPVIRDVGNANLRREGTPVVRHRKNVMVLAWRDKQVVKMVTTMHQNNMENIQVWQKGHHEKVTKQKPTCIVEYNNAMNGVDKLDQNIAYYPFVRKSHKWSKKFVAYLFEISLFNAFIIYKAKNPNSKGNTLMAFIQSVVKSWTSQKPMRQAGGQENDPHTVRDDPPAQMTPRAPYKTDPRERLDVGFAAHPLVSILPTPNKQHPTRRCRVCVRKGLRRETSYYCKGCGVPLHFGECYTVYHSKAHYNA
ncbi:piggyBac transposable element-derived protein 4-like isoform X2 [Sphaeramia orbicularis]|uniref:piggyBac transposable element-derived protein 4-like isoform X2 n=1 Tax=Sphaeramia orbicularis TaxID=375764 RepID=UPI00117DFF52|nr:piggyBac transposable element-derived protein 4-like isoform X2 [Sphaeramia orbicularis]